MEMTTVLVFVGILAISKAQSGDDINLPDTEFLVVVGGGVGIIIFVMCIGWFCFFYKIYYIEKESNKQIKLFKRERDQRLLLERRQRARYLESRNIRRAMDNSLADNNAETDFHYANSQEDINAFNQQYYDDVNDDLFFFMPTRPTRPSTLHEEEGEPPPPSFDSVVSLGSSTTHITSSSRHPPSSFQQRMLGSLQSLPRIAAADSTDNEELMDGERGGRRDEGARRNLERERVSQDSTRDGRGPPRHAVGRTSGHERSAHGGLTNIPVGYNGHLSPINQSLSSFDDSSDEGDETSDEDSDTTASTSEYSSSINIDELIHKQQMKMPKIGMVESVSQLGGASYSQNKTTQISPDHRLQSPPGPIPSHTQHFERFGQARQPIRGRSSHSPIPMKNLANPLYSGAHNNQQPLGGQGLMIGINNLNQEYPHSSLSYIASDDHVLY